MEKILICIVAIVASISVISCHTIFPIELMSLPQNVPYPLPKDCEEIRRNGFNESGLYIVYPRSRLPLCPLKVYCDMKTDGGGWLVIQRRGDFGSSIRQFARYWHQYKIGFGSLQEDFWLGNDAIFALTNQAAYSVRFDLQNVGGVWAYAHYDSFWIDSEDNQFMLHISGFHGNAGDSMSYHDENYFSTPDRDNDRSYYFNCANDRSSGWWFNFCMESNLNGIAWEGPYSGTNNYNDGIEWQSFMGAKNSLIATEIKIRPNFFCTAHHSTTP